MIGEVIMSSGEQTDQGGAQQSQDPPQQTPDELAKFVSFLLLDKHI